MKISIVIPTRERADYLGASIRTALAIKDDALEVVVNDNASGDHTREVVEGFDDTRLLYFNAGARVSMRENFNLGVANSTGDYVIVIGDDDGVLPRQIQMLRSVLETHRPDGVSWNRATYVWPVGDFGRKTGGVRFYRDGMFGGPRAYDPAQKAQALLQGRLSDMVPTPNIYHGCVSRAYLERIAPAPGLFFDSSIPDVNFEYRTILTGGRFLHCDHAFSINGISPASNGNAYKGFATDDPRSKPAQQFEAETRADTLRDVLENARFVPLCLFASLETVRERMDEAREPDYSAWYRMLLSSAQNRGETTAQVETILRDYADVIGRPGLMDKAAALPRKRKKTLGQRIARLRSQANSFRRSAEMEGANTILTAAQVYDSVLDRDFDRVTGAEISPNRAWRGALSRARSFAKQI